MDKNYILFKSYNQGLALESLLKKSKIKYTISPTPRQLSVCCGMSIMYYKEDEDNIKKIVKENNIKVLGFYTLNG
ncbi:Protein of unknown function [Caloramator quimbayensis]|uniref:Putative Se/S carrier protein-like domain-containing protein n=1 Tax=Caloramator quimbayensis TaxID=1147123 RepID=A0A1T4YB62_9CLOT|nr:DUF3343 domain-containing protein [Caloramator quimbayensis]SKA98758.1 Protein of unknown function [Caloramator quimbayensis]